MTRERWDSNTPGRIPKRKQEGITEHPAEGCIVDVTLEGATFIIPAYDPAAIWGPAPWCSRSAELVAPTGGLTVTTTAPESTTGNRSPTRPVSPTGAPLVGTGTNAQVVYQTLIARGLSPAAATGVVGNLMAESSVNPSAVEPGGAGRGIAQWSVNGRWVDAQAAGASLGNLQSQVDFMISEASSGSPGVGETWAKLSGVNDVNEAANIWMVGFELPGDQSWKNAVRRANMGVQAVNGKQKPSTTIPGQPAPVPDAQGPALNDATPTADATQPMPTPGDRCLIDWAGPDRNPWVVGWWSSIVVQPNAVDAAELGPLGQTAAGGAAPISAGGSTTGPSAGDGTSAPATSELGARLVAGAKTHLGATNYVYGEAGPTKFDCSGLVMYVARQLGISLPHNSAAQYNLLASQGKTLTLAQARNTPGALLFRGPGEHEAISLGDGVHTVEAHSHTDGVIIGVIAGRTWTNYAHL